jgi:hypothetical protein
VPSSGDYRLMMRESMVWLGRQGLLICLYCLTAPVLLLNPNRLPIIFLCLYWVWVFLCIVKKMYVSMYLSVI